MYLLLILGIFTVNNNSFSHMLDMSNVVNVVKECPNGKVIVIHSSKYLQCDDIDIWTPRTLLTIK